MPLLHFTHLVPKPQEEAHLQVSGRAKAPWCPMGRTPSPLSPPATPSTHRRKTLDVSPGLTLRLHASL